MASDLKIGMLMHVVWRCTRSCFPPRKRGFMLLIGNHPLICILQIMLENESYLKPPVLALYQSVPSQCPARVDLQMKGWPSLQVAFDWNYWSALLPYSDSDDSLVVYLPLWKIGTCKPTNMRGSQQYTIWWLYSMPDGLRKQENPMFCFIILLTAIAVDHHQCLRLGKHPKCNPNAKLNLPARNIRISC